MKHVFEETREVIAHSLPYVRGKTLDLGAGTAKYKGLIQTKAESYTAFDLIPGDRIDIVGHITNTGLPDASYDTIFCTQVFEHIPQPFDAVEEISRILKTSGHCIITAPFLIPYHADPHDYYRYTVEGLRNLFERKGFQIIEYGSYSKLFIVLSEFIHHTAFSPYAKRKKGSYRVMRALIATATFLDRFVSGKRIYGNAFIIAKKV